VQLVDLARRHMFAQVPVGSPGIVRVTRGSLTPPVKLTMVRYASEQNESGGSCIKETLPFGRRWRVLAAHWPAPQRPEQSDRAAA
jgi:hypothetical protein